ncbi:MAG TPA: ABC transporter permease [Candidatus Manganitrophaceae bacterium]|nr:ABC transporter permease [Candidatus Manganitrophaceae bacterium]
MRNILTLSGKELKLYFISPIFYVVGMVFLAVSDYLFYLQVNIYSSISMQMMRFQGNLPQLNIHQAVFVPTFLSMSIILLLIMPLLTMRLFAEEKKGRTTELLLTSPVTITEIVLGKFLAAWTVYLILLGLTLHMPILLGLFTQITWKPLLSSYLGLALMGAVFLAIGLFASSLTENQIVAAVISFGILIGFWLIGVSAQSAGEGAFGQVTTYLSILSHLENFVKGLIDTRDLTYFVSMATLGLFLTHRVVESQRWK